VCLALSIRGVRKASPNVVLGQFWKIGANLLVRHARREVGQNIVDGYAHSANAWLSAALPAFDRYYIAIWHIHRRLLP
jgi:hypothetical protein